jgi:hypothetical protein
MPDNTDNDDLTAEFNRRLRSDFSMPDEYLDYNTKEQVIRAAVEVFAEMAGDLRNTPDWRGGSFWFSREDWGVITDALIEHRESATRRKAANSESTSDERADTCVRLIETITRELRQAPVASNPELEALRAKLRQAPAASEQPKFAYAHRNVEPDDLINKCPCEMCSRPAASEDTIEQAAEVGARALADVARYDYDTLSIDNTNHLRRTARTVLNAARGLLADGTDRRRIENVLALLDGDDRGIPARLDDIRAALTDTEDPAALTGGQP